MPIENGDILRARSEMQFPDSSKLQNVWWFRVTGTGEADEADVAGEIEDALEVMHTMLLPFFYIGMSFTTLVIEQVAWEETPPPAGWKVQQTLQDAPWMELLECTNVANLLPPANAAMFRMVPVLRKHQGRKYLGGFTENDNLATGLISEALQAELLDVAACTVFTYAIPNSALFFNFVVPNMSGPATLGFTEVIVSNRWKSQRRRETGVGI